MRLSMPVHSSKNHTTTQVVLLTLIVNTAVIGNYSDVNTDVKVPGIFAPGTYSGTAVNLLPCFSLTRTMAAIVARCRISSTVAAQAS
jgi:hypothetical protein